MQAKIHKDTIVKKHIRNNYKIYKVLKTLFIVMFYSASVYVIEYHFQLPLFVNLAILYGIVKALGKI